MNWLSNLYINFPILIFLLYFYVFLCFPDFWPYLLLLLNAVIIIVLISKKLFCDYIWAPKYMELFFYISSRSVLCSLMEVVFVCPAWGTTFLHVNDVSNYLTMMLSVFSFWANSPVGLWKRRAWQSTNFRTIALISSFHPWRTFFMMKTHHMEDKCWNICW